MACSASLVLVLLTVSIRSFSCSAFLQVIVSPEDVNVSEPLQAFLFPCVALSSEADIDITWLHEGTPVISNDSKFKVHVAMVTRGNFTIKTSVLEVCITSPELTGGYACNVSHGQSHQEYSFHVAGPVWITKSPPINVNVSYSGEQTFSCKFLSPNEEAVNVSWSVDGRPPPCHFKVSNHQLMNGLTVTTSEVTVTYLDTPLSGQYACIAENGWSKAKAIFDVHVKDFEYIATSPPITYYDTHSSVILVCALIGHDIQDLKWTYNETSLSALAQQTAVTTEVSMYGPFRLYQSFLKLCPASDGLRLEKGDYSCEGISSNTSMPLASVTMSVCPIPDPFGFLIRPPRNVIISSGTLFLTCVVYGTREAELSVTWDWNTSVSVNTSGRVNITESQKERGNFLLYVSILSIGCVAPEDEGVYVCKASHGNQTLQESVTVTLISELMFTELPAAQFKKLVEVASSVTLNCTVMAYPAPSVTWLKDGIPVKKTKDVLLQETGYQSGGKTVVQSTLTLLATSSVDSGLYWCLATNVYSTLEMATKYQLDILEQKFTMGTEEGLLRPQHNSHKAFVAGPAVCMLALMAVLISLCLFRELRFKTLPLVNFCIATSLTCLFSILSSSASWSAPVCTTFSALLQVAVLIAAMAIPNIILLALRRIKKVAAAAFLLVNWGLPIIICLGSVLSDINEYNNRSCHPKGLPFWLGLVLPLGVIMAVSVGIIFTSCTVCSWKPQHEEAETDHRKWLKDIAAVGFILLLFDISLAVRLANSALDSEISPAFIFLVLPIISGMFFAIMGTFTFIYTTILSPKVQSRVKTMLCMKWSNFNQIIPEPSEALDTPCKVDLEGPSSPGGGSATIPDNTFDILEEDVLDEQTEL